MNDVLERLRAEPARQVGELLAGLEQEPRPEAADVAVGELRPVVERDERRGGTDPSASSAPCSSDPGHAQVDEEDASRLEAEHQVLAAPVDRGDALPVSSAATSRGSRGSTSRVSRISTASNRRPVSTGSRRRRTDSTSGSSGTRALPGGAGMSVTEH